MVSSRSEAAFQDLVYEAAIEPANWGAVLEQFTEVMGGNGANLIFQDQVTGAGRGLLHGYDPADFAAYFDRFATNNPLLKITDFPVRPRVLTDEDKLPKEDLIRTEYYNDFGRKIDVHSTLILRLAIKDSHTTVLNLGRPANRGPFHGSDLDTAKRLHPHLVRAFRLASRLANMDDRQSRFEEFFELSPSALFVVDAGSRVHSINAAGRALIAAKRGLSIEKGELRAGNPRDSNRLQALIGVAACADSALRAGGAMPLDQPARRKPLSILVMPAHSERISLFRPRLTALVCVIDPAMPVTTPEQRLRDLFGLTRAEARTAARLLAGSDLREAAEFLDLSYNTLRVHVSRILAKTETSGQSELIQLMTRVSLCH